MGGNMARRKPKRIKRSHLKRFSSEVVNGGRAVPKKGSSLDQHLMAELYNNKNKIKTFDQAIPATRFTPLQQAAVAPGANPSAIPRIEVAQKRLWSADRRQGVDHFLQQPLMAGITLYFHADEHFFVRRKKGIVSESIVYGSRETAMDAFEHGKITWINSKPSS
jgi:hypothetical protein